jgi:hypothetical protein
LGSNIPNNADVQTALQRELTLFKIDGKPAAQDKLVHISVDDLEYGYSNAKPGMPFFRKTLPNETLVTFGSLNDDPWKQPVVYSGNLQKDFPSAGGADNQDDMLYDGGLPPPNRSNTVVVDNASLDQVVTTWGATNEVKGKTKQELVMNYDGATAKTTNTGNNFTGYPYELDYFSSVTADRSSKYGKPKYRWAYYFDDDTDTSGTTSGGVFL